MSPSVTPPPLVAWILLAVGAVILVACLVLAFMLLRRRPEPAKTAAQRWAETDRYYYLDEPQARPAPKTKTREPVRRPQLLIGGLAVAAVVVLAAGGTFLLSSGDSSDGSSGGDGKVAAAPSPSRTPMVAPSGLGPGIMAGNTELCLTAAYLGDGAVVSLRKCQSSKTQQWLPESDGTIRLGGRCLDVAGANTSMGAVLQAANCNNNAAQLFEFRDGKLISGLTGACVDVRGGQLLPGAGAVIQRCSEVGDRVWLQLL